MEVLVQAKGWRVSSLVAGCSCLCFLKMIWLCRLHQAADSSLNWDGLELSVKNENENQDLRVRGHGPQQKRVEWTLQVKNKLLPQKEEFKFSTTSAVMKMQHWVCCVVERESRAGQQNWWFSRFLLSAFLPLQALGSVCPKEWDWWSTSSRNELPPKSVWALSGRMESRAATPLHWKEKVVMVWGSD